MPAQEGLPQPVWVIGGTTGVTNTTPLTVNVNNSVETYSAPNVSDSFGRRRYSSPYTLFDAKQLDSDMKAFFFDDATTSGSASSVYSQARASTMLTLSNQTGTRVMQSKRRMNYQPGKSQLIFITFVMGSTPTNVTKRVGYFDDNNGIFLKVTDSRMSFVIRSSVSGSPVDTVIHEGEWNGETIPNFDITKAQILAMDFEWLGVGVVRFGFVIDGSIVYTHYQQHANVATSVYLSNPDLPIRYEIASTSNATSTLEAICSTVISEGGVETSGVQFSASRGSTGLQTGNNDSLYPLIAMRLRSTRLWATISLLPPAILCTTSSPFEWQLLVNPTVTGTAFSYTAVTNSSIEVDVSRTNTTTVSGGTVIASGYALQGQEGAGLMLVPTYWKMGSTIAGVSDVVVVAVRRLSTSAETYYCSINWIEDR